MANSYWLKWEVKFKAKTTKSGKTKALDEIDKYIQKKFQASSYSKGYSLAFTYTPVPKGNATVIIVKLLEEEPPKQASRSQRPPDPPPILKVTHNLSSVSDIKDMG